MQTKSALLALCAGNLPVAQRPVTRSLDVFFHLRLNKRLTQQLRGWWCETPSRHYDVNVMKISHSFEQPCCCRQWATISILTRGVSSLPHALTSRRSNKNALEVSVLMRNYGPRHHNDVIMRATASQITSLAIVYSTVYSGADQSKNQSSASLAFVWGIHRGPMNSSHKWPVTREIFPFDDVIMHRYNYTPVP